jgi:hypothetical protein
LKFIFAACFVTPLICLAQSNLTIYTDSLAPGWADWSYNCTRNFFNTSPVHSGSDSISCVITNAYGGIALHHNAMTNSAYSNVSFWLNGGVSGGQQLQMYGTLNVNGSDVAQSGRFYLSTPAANTWQQYTVPLSALTVANTTNFTGFAIQDSAGGTEPIFYVDDIQLISSAVPAVVHLTVNAGQPIRTADARWFGMNVAQWDNLLDTPQSLTQFSTMGTRALRFPGGSNSDDYHWLYNRQDHNGWTWVSSLANFIHVVTNANAISMITLNYGDGYTNEAAAWVAYCNASTSSAVPLGVDPESFNWQTAGYWASLRAAAPLGSDDGRNFLRLSRSAPLGFKYWEIGNEIYGGWEIDSNSLPHDPYTYARRAKDYISLIRAVDPTVKIGVVVTPGEDSYGIGSNAVINPRTLQSHTGWTPVLLATLTSLGVTPDFIIHHRYPQNPGGEDDTGLLASSIGWAADASNLRQQLTDYVGPGSTNIELLCTENNSVSSNPGKQSTSLVNGLFMADSLAQLMQTEFNALFWWNMRNGSENFTGNTNSSLYGWRMFGDYGVTEGTDLYPPFYTAKLMQRFVQAGDTIVSAASDYTGLSTYAAQRLNGSLALLTINKNAANTFTGQVAVAGYVPSPGSTIYSYGIPQDNAAKTGIGSPDVAQTNYSGAGTNFTYAFAPYSATVMVLAPTPAILLPLPTPPAATQFVFQLQGLNGVPYVIQRSTDLMSWTPVSTNTLVGSTLNVTNALDPSFPTQFWRAVWQP